MATITPSGRFMTRLIPAVATEAIVLVVCVLLYVYTEQLVWIFIAVAAGVVFAIWIVAQLMRHRDEWQMTDNRRP